MESSLLTQTIVAGALVSAVILAFLLRYSPRRGRWPQIVAGVIVLDQGSKWVIAELFKGTPHSYLGGWLQVSYCTNFLQGFGETSPWLLCATLVGIVATIRLHQMLVSRGYVMSSVTEAGLALMLGGIAVIAAERAWSGAVVDFLQLGANAEYVYNFADLSALGGIVLLAARGVSILPRAIGEELAAEAAKGRGR